MIPVTAIITTRNEETNIRKCLKSISSIFDQIIVIDSDSTDNTKEIAGEFADHVANLQYDHARIIPWIFQWGLDNLPIRNEWVFILEADQIVTRELACELEKLFSGPPITHNGFYIKRKQIFRGCWFRFGGYGSKYLLKLFRRAAAELDPLEQDTRVYVHGTCGRLKCHLEENNLKESAIQFYLQKHLRYVDAFAQEELERRAAGFRWKAQPRIFGTPDERILWSKRFYYNLPLYFRSALYFMYRYFFLLGFLDGKQGFIFHFLQSFWFRLVVDIRLSELMGQRSTQSLGRKYKS